MIRTLALAGGILGAAGLSQYPEFSQQYLQRLAGQVDALDIVVADFEGSAMRAGLTRSEALAELTGTPFLTDRQADMRRTFRRHAVLTDNLATLREASPLERIIMPQRMVDPATFTATWGDYRPAMPLTVAGIVSGLIGFTLAWLMSRAFLALMLAPLRKRQPRPRPARSHARRGEPVVLRQTAASPSPVPRLSGVRRDHR
ncbi:DUF2937 family protein [Loktanella sp. DJP18]|uniref:DUF2937 family protein n=1 Tax=Loktanella sp. DJP18 TaxID=3409788 RepID=UPI003BB51A41